MQRLMQRREQDLTSNKPEGQTVITSAEYIQQCLRDIERDGYTALKQIAPERRTYELYLAAVKIDICTLDCLLNPNTKAWLKPDECHKLCLEAIKIYKWFALNRIAHEMRTYEMYLATANTGVNVLVELNGFNERKKFTAEQYANLAFVVIKNVYIKSIDPNFSDDTLRKFIAHYLSINIKMDDIGTFFSDHADKISRLYPLLGKNIFLLMEKLLVTSGDHLKRFLKEIELVIAPRMLAACSKNISRLIEGVDFKNASKKASQFKLYLYLCDEEKAKINILLDDSSINIETIPNVMRELLIKRFYDYLNIPYDNKKHNAMDVLSNEQLADLYGLLVVFKMNSSSGESKIFFAMLKLYLTDIPFQCLHQPDQMNHYGDAYLTSMAAHNKKLREELAAAGIDIKKAFSYTKEVKITFDEHQKQHILNLLAAIYKKIKESKSDKRMIKNFLKQIEKGGENKIDDTKLLRMLSDNNIKTLKEIVTLLPEINADYLELTQLTINLDVLKNYEPRKFHIEMWDKSKIDTLFLGDYLNCCLATTGSKQDEYSPRVFDDAFLMPVVIDEATKKPVCGAWLFLADATHSSSRITKDTVANYFEINSGIAENKALMNVLVTNLLSYIGQFSDAIGATEFLMRTLTYGKVPDFCNFGTFRATHERTIRKVGGYFGTISYYLNAVGTGDFYQFDLSSFNDDMQQLIVPELKIPVLAWQDIHVTCLDDLQLISHKIFVQNRFDFLLKNKSVFKPDISYYTFIRRWLPESDWDKCHELFDQATYFELIVYSISSKEYSFALKLLKSSKIDPQMTTNDGITLLHLICNKLYFVNEMEDIVIELLKLPNINPNVVDDLKTTALSYAMVHGHINIVKQFVKCPSFDINQVDGSGNTALWHAVNSHSIDSLSIVNVLLQAPHINPNYTEDTNKLTPLHLAAFLGKSELLKVLLSFPGIDPEPYTSNFCTPLMLAVKNNQYAVVKTYLALPNFKPEFFEAMLIQAIDQNNIDMVKLLLTAPHIDMKDILPHAFSAARAKNNESIINALMNRSGVYFSISPKNREVTLQISKLRSDQIGQCLLAILPIVDQIAELSIDRCQLNADNIMHISNVFLGSKSSLKALLFNEAAFGDDMVYILAKSLIKNTSLKELYMNDCDLKTSSAAILGEMLTVNKTLSSLLLPNNNIFDEGADYLKNALENGASITSLGLSQNHISQTGSMQLAKGLHKNFHMQKLLLFGNEVSGETELDIKVSLERNIRLGQGKESSAASSSAFSMFNQAVQPAIRQQFTGGPDTTVSTSNNVNQ